MHNPLGPAVAAALGLALSGTGDRASAPPRPESVPAAAQADDWTTYRHEGYGFEFQHPELCPVREHGDGSFSLGDRIELVVADLEGMTLGEYVDGFVANKTEGSDWRITSRKPGWMGGRETTTIEYRFGGLNRFGTVTFVGGDGEVYMWGLTAGVFACDEPRVYDRIISTFRTLE